MSPDKRNERREDDALLREMIDAVKAGAPRRGQYEAARRNLLNKLDQRLDQSLKEHWIMSMIKGITRPGVRWVSATGLAAVLIAVGVFFGSSGRNPAQAYAAAVERIRKAVTVSFATDWSFGENQKPTALRIAFREPALERIEMEWQGVRMIQIFDTAKNKNLLLVPENKMGVEMEMDAAVQADRERIELVKMMTQTVKTLPERAEDVVGEKTIDGRKVTGFRFGGQTLWIDTQTKSLVRVETQENGRQLVMRDFQLDPPDLDAAAFSLKLPAGYQAMASQALKVTNTTPGEENLIQYLRLASEMIQSHQFPATTNPMEILALQKAGKLKPESESSLGSEQARVKFMQDFSSAARGQVMFTMGLKPENDWHYAGQGVTRGDGKTPIAWWKPSGLKNYRIIWGDLRVTEEPPEVIPTAKGK